MEKRIGHRAVGKLAAAAAVGLVGFSAGQQADAALVVDIRATHVNGAPVTTEANGDASETLVIPGGVGTTVSYEIALRVSGVNGLDDEGLQASHGVFRTPTGGLLGDLSAIAPSAPFNESGSAPGSAIDADLDGDLDWGPAPNGGTPSSAFFIARSASMQRAGTRVDAETEEWVVGTGTWTLKDGQTTGTETFIDFIRRRNPGNPGGNNSAYAAWNEDGSGTSSVRNGLNPYTVDGLNIVVPEPSGIALAGLAGIGLLGRRRNKNA
jgi:hypothetical protein